MDARRLWPRELLLALLFAPPVLGLVFEPDGLRHELAHQARSLLAIWVYVMVLGVAIQLATDRVTAWRPALLDGPAGAARHVALTLAVVAAATVVLAAPLAWTCPGLEGRGATLLLRGALLGTTYVLVGRLYASALRARTAEAEAARNERRLAEARFSALVARTQPHFLHNALGAAAELVHRDPEAAARALRDLGALFREIVQATSHPAVRAADELETARRYLDIQRLRFAPRLEVEVTRDPLADDERVPPLVLLPLVENAVLHGLSDGEPTRVRVELRLEAEHVVFEVSDDGPGAGSSRHGEGTGLGVRDVEERLASLYGGGASVAARPREPGARRPGHVVELRVPREDA